MTSASQARPSTCAVAVGSALLNVTSRGPSAAKGPQPSGHVRVHLELVEASEHVSDGLVHRPPQRGWAATTARRLLSAIFVKWAAGRDAAHPVDGAWRA